MGRTALLVLLGLAVGCAANPPRGDPGYCAQLFDQLDVFEQTVVGRGVPLAGPDFRQMQLARIRQAGCLTMTSDLVGLEELARTLPPRPRAAAVGSVAVQAGVVTNMQDDARALAFFEALGYRARSVGAPGLGRRVYVEATSPEAVRDIVAVALQAGFVGPYPSRYVAF